MRRITQLLSILLCFVLLFEQSGFAQVSGSIDLSAYITGLKGALAPDNYRPLHLRYLGYNPITKDFKLLIDVGEGLAPSRNQNTKEENITQETAKLMQYFFIGLTLVQRIILGKPKAR